MQEREQTTEETQGKPRPYLINAQTQKVQVEEDVPGGDKKFLVTYEFVSLNGGNIGLYYEREKNIARVSENIRKTVARPKYSDEKANRVFFPKVVKGATAVPSNKPDATAVVIPTERLRLLTPEKMKKAVDRFLEFHAKVIAEDAGKGELDFMFEGEGHLDIELKIGDSDDPAYRLLLRWTRPDGHRRTSFRDAHAHMEEDRGGDLPVRRTVINPDAGVKFNDEFFLTVLDSPLHSTVVFLNPDWNEESGEQMPKYIPYADDLTIKVGPDAIPAKQAFLHFLNPAAKVEISATVAQHFNKGERE